MCQEKVTWKRAEPEETRSRRLQLRDVLGRRGTGDKGLCPRWWDRRTEERRHEGPAAQPSPPGGGHDGGPDVPQHGFLIEECPGQAFQVSRLLFHLSSALGPGSDILLDPYLSGWEELIRFMESLGPLVSLFSYKVQEKIVLLRQIQAEDAENAAYSSLHSMMEAELLRGVVSFDRHAPSGCRTLLRLHRSLRWLQLLLEKLAAGPDADGRLATPGEMCREAYREVLAPHHPWLLRRAAEAAFSAMPQRAVLLRLVCVERQEEAAPVLERLIGAIGEVHSRTHNALQDRGMLDLP
uniref:Glycolipid transfer protein domain-containing protein n=1 Tax=Denticeps clupeoides TaxID=299321 RepID=A0AAY4BQ41_9TELE